MTPQELDDFKSHKLKAKELFSIQRIGKVEAYEFVRKYHYLGDAKFFTVECFGLFTNTGKLCGCATYSCPQGSMALKGWFSLDNSCKDVYELSRLCLHPALNGTNATSFLLGGSLRVLKKEGKCRAVITLASSDRHIGSIYQVCNFTYYGLTEPKNDFFDESGKKPRGVVRDKLGVWVAKPRKHRYAYIFDKSLKCNYPEQPRPEKGNTLSNECCYGMSVVWDRRYNHYYTCPHCTGRLERETDFAWLDNLLDEGGE